MCIFVNINTNSTISHKILSRFETKQNFSFFRTPDGQLYTDWLGTKMTRSAKKIVIKNLNQIKTKCLLLLSGLSQNTACSPSSPGSSSQSSSGGCKLSKLSLLLLGLTPSILTLEIWLLLPLLLPPHPMKTP